MMCQHLLPLSWGWRQQSVGMAQGSNNTDDVQQPSQTHIFYWLHGVKAGAVATDARDKKVYSNDEYDFNTENAVVCKGANVGFCILPVALGSAQVKSQHGRSAQEW